MKYGGVKLVLWTETSHLGEIMQSCKCFQNVSKISTLTYNIANSFILMNAIILNIIHNIFNIRDTEIVSFYRKCSCINLFIIAIVISITECINRGIYR